MCIQNLKFVALPVPEIIGAAQKIWAVPGYAHAPFSPKFFMGFCSDGPLNLPASLYLYPEVIGGTQKNFDSPCMDTHTVPFLPNFSWAFVRMDPVNVSAKFAVRSFTRS